MYEVASPDRVRDSLTRFLRVQLRPELSERATATRLRLHYEFTSEMKIILNSEQIHVNFKKCSELLILTFFDDHDS